MPELNEPAFRPPEELPPVPVTTDTSPTPEATLTPSEPPLEPAPSVPEITPHEPVNQAPIVSEPPTIPDWTPSATRLSGMSRQPRRGLPLSTWLTALLVPYAIVATVGVIFLFQKQQLNRTPHILESIPDQGLYEDFFDGRRRETIPPVSKAGDKTGASKIIPTNEPIGDLKPIKLGETKRIGMISVTPVSITRDRLNFAWKAGKADVQEEEVLVLELRVRNEGPLIFRPDDETFNRTYFDDSKSPIYTYLEIGKERYYGAVSDPTSERLSFPVCNPLLPGQTGIIHVVAYKSRDGKQLAINAWKPGEHSLWRVHLRRGKEEITLTNGRKRSVWVTSVVPISFSADDIQKSDANGKK